MRFTASPAWTLRAPCQAPCQQEDAPPPALAPQGAFFSADLAGGGSGPVLRRSRPAVYQLAESEPAESPAEPSRPLARAPRPERGLRVEKIKPDGKCMFRAMARGMSHGQGVVLREAEETLDADLLRTAVLEALCQGPEARKPYAEVAYSVEHVEGGFDSYCSRLRNPAFWGGEAELVVLSRLLQVPISVYQTAAEAKRRGWGFVPIVELGQEFRGPRKGRAARPPVKLLYVNGNHYDLLL